MKMSSLAAVIGGAMVIAAPLAGHEYARGMLVIEHPWTKETAPGQKAGGAFMVIVNNGKSADRLTAASTPSAASTQIHNMEVKNGVMRMFEVKGGLPIPAGGSVALKPGGYHIMFFGLKRQFRQGERIPLTLTFARAGRINVEMLVQPITSSGPEEADHGKH